MENINYTSCTKKEFRLTLGLNRKQYERLFTDKTSPVYIELLNTGYEPTDKQLSVNQIKICLIDICGLDQYYGLKDFYDNLHKLRKGKLYDKN